MKCKRLSSVSVQFQDFCFFLSDKMTIQSAQHGERYFFFKSVLQWPGDSKRVVVMVPEIALPPPHFFNDSFMASPSELPKMTRPHERIWPGASMKYASNRLIKKKGFSLNLFYDMKRGAINNIWHKYQFSCKSCSSICEG